MTGEFQKRIEAIPLGNIDDYAMCGWVKHSFERIVEEAKKEVPFPSIIDYPCEDGEARSLYEEKNRLIQEWFMKWFGEQQ